MVSSLPATGIELELCIHGLNHEGQGVARTADSAEGESGLVVFVPNALPGENVRVRVQHRAQRHLVAELITRHNDSADRRKPPCILANDCGGCSVQHLEDQAQALWKQTLVQETLRRIGGLSIESEPIIPAQAPTDYRNRAVIPLERTPEGRLRAGFYRSGSHRIVNMNRCPVLDPRLDRLIAPLKHDLEVSDWPVDVNLSEGGGLRHLALRLGHHTGDVLLTLISSHDDLPDLAIQAAIWMERWPELVGVCLNLQPRPNNTLMGPTTRCIAGRPWLIERFAGLQYQIGPDTFFQVNTAQAEQLLPLLLQALQPSPDRRIVDAYCGIGTFTLPLAAAGAQVLGLEQQAGSVEQARINAALNGLNNVELEVADVAIGLPEALRHADALLLDPPRKGLPHKVCEAIVADPPARVAYLSCNPASLARDLARLSADGRLVVRSIQPLDFFPQTSHVEALAVLERVISS
ncbi:23S rRNA (uracil(1939)-C(5))-methyltransferase RlmD [Synechococcus sp. CS-602]|uniref:23S rRNA (uracil(1939)-C(5))-methyltransferase RlmD n=1 Tax=Synechococcus sp. CS-602 TaxID=2847982 RepID=UPI0008FF2B95|nr:23S rRNA (uracil(1939)-C(5))-methyltransferase RlmD [Synechococcus sp. CS-602]APD48962.1 23S rRNA (uracil-5-)-methyltransferase RumA [Synechococcus sp. SynAce01]MCT0201092.1 23S rRNA (uracil(1939)-C(5))-methyltransferase RlmD [Synechococcus sp. CS-603]MCT0246357.1 23S rRNA (uracil(1939)-C(5))-methyltransferase RlmD [Synechococcus sp. CS-601]TWB93382.1 23S rRNA m(5)U-1939 methyltransferase [Synechococcus sp. Ace-Pa]MCT0204585.1 23S rRNA (uracil(1939)-C(5))-methyltransferase RlmD [Synechococc